MFELKEMSITITGAASGMGRATALLAARLGARVTLSDLNSEAGEQVAAEIAAAGERRNSFAATSPTKARLPRWSQRQSPPTAASTVGSITPACPTSASCSTN